MAILNIQTQVAGLAGTVPSFIYVNTDDTYATVTTAGYLNSSSGYEFDSSQIAAVKLINAGVATAMLFNLEINDGVVSLIPV